MTTGRNSSLKKLTRTAPQPVLSPKETNAKLRNVNGKKERGRGKPLILTTGAGRSCGLFFHQRVFVGIGFVG